MSDSKRKPGPYHVWHNEDGAYEVAYWNGVGWEIPGSEMYFRDEHWAEIGPRVCPPLPAEVEARAFFEAHLDQLDPVVQRHVRALLENNK